MRTTPLTVAVLLVAGCSAAPDPPAAPPAPTSSSRGALYDPSSPWRTPIPDDAELHPRSAEMVDLILEDAAERGFVLAVKRYTVPVYFADAETPRYRVELTARWAPKGVIRGVPIPAGARPDPGSDGSIAIVDLDQGCEWDLWRFRRTRGRWAAAWGNALETEGDGIFPHGLSARGSGFALPAGLVWPHELAAGHIDHVLYFAYGFTSRAGAVPPATESDGWSRHPDALPEGARVRLDPTLDLDSLGLEPYERTIAEAMQTYGMILGDDSGGGLSLQAVHPWSLGGSAYEGLLPDGRYVDLSKIPLHRLQVLDFPTPTPKDELVEGLRLVPTDCATFR
jgi:hypothetical protein